MTLNKILNAKPISSAKPGLIDGTICLWRSPIGNDMADIHYWYHSGNHKFAGKAEHVKAAKKLLKI